MEIQKKETLQRRRYKILNRKHIKKAVAVIALGLFSIISLIGCNKKEEGPVDEVLSAITLSDLTPGNFYVKSGDSYYLLPIEGSNFDLSKPAVSTDDTANGMISSEENRLLDFIYKDAAIPTLYRNDQLIYVSNGDLSDFTWERFSDYGFSIGISGLEIAKSGKITTGENSVTAVGSNLSSVLSDIGYQPGISITVDKINGTSLSSKYLNDGGIITGMSKDSTANIDLYSGTQPVPVTSAADTRYFKSFEIYNTSRYSLSTDGYAIVEIPSYLKSGYYLINNTGFVKFLNIDRGNDESGINLDVPYYYLDDEGNVLTFYEWQEANGIATDTIETETPGTIDINSYPEKMLLNIDNSQDEIKFTVAYRYKDSSYEEEANQNGLFPRVAILDPLGNVTSLSADDSMTNDPSNESGYSYLSATCTGAVAGEWYLLFSNFDNIEKNITCDVTSGNATTWLHTGSSSRGSIYYNASSTANDFTITWENADRAGTVSITAPDGTKFDKTTTPGNVITDEFGKVVIRVPNLVAGNYQFNIDGDTLGRIWIDCSEAAVQTPATDPNTSESVASTDQTSTAETTAPAA